ncbi:Rv3654c family TadE-like protein [Actinomyces glycerinitolerans]|uniref:Uncharacterized protein n=1 Tax=Actinomyces glycerinitolerans TaxID=1892869 RepID=A0A1M4RZV4_9ACTO|nr:Hypothetical protein ACGLYG10_1698 [Actinomyces glycerinitolerans]
MSRAETPPPSTGVGGGGSEMNGACSRRPCLGHSVAGPEQAGDALARAPDRGSGTVMVLGIIAVALCLALGATGLIQAQAAGGRARAAADLAALAGATALTSVVAPADPCATAQRVARANGAELAACTVDGEDVTVAVGVPTRILGVPRRADAAARAGPVNPL